MKQKEVLRLKENMSDSELSHQELIFISMFNKYPSNYKVYINYKFSEYLKVLKDWGYRELKSERFSNSSLNMIFVKDQFIIFCSIADYSNKPTIDDDKITRFHTSFYYHVSYKDMDEYNRFIKFVKANEYKNDLNATVGIIVQTSNGLDISYINYEKLDIALEDNYNDDFNKINLNIIKDLSTSKPGLHILHGIPGTGKTSYIKYLMNYKNIKKPFIFVPAAFIASLSDPSFITLLIDRAKSSILIVEDAEEALVSSGGIRNSAVSNLLNLSDGILGSTLNIQIIATFNTEFDNIDPAITRKGRLLNIYEFDKLNIEKTKELMKSINPEFEVLEPMTLADIYHNHSENITKSKNNKITI